MSSTTCLVCKERSHKYLWNFRETLNGRQLPLRKCTSCGFIRPSPLPYSADDAASVYEDNPITVAFDRKRTSLGVGSAQYLEYCKIFSPYEAAWKRYGLKGSHLDIGCGSGHLLYLSKNSGMSPEGIELDKGLVRALGREKFKASYGTTRMLVNKKRKFDLITANHVLEHVVDIDAFLDDVRRLLKPGGHFVFAFPYIYGAFAQVQRTGWYGQGYGQHVNFFSKRSLRMLLQRHGFEVLEMKTLSLEHIPAGTPKVLRPIFDATIRMLIIAELGDNLFTVARLKTR